MMLAFLKVSILHLYIFIYSWKFPCGISRHLDLHPSGPSHYKLRMGWDKAREPQTRSLKGDSIQPTGHGSTYHSKQLKLLFFEKNEEDYSVNTNAISVWILEEALNVWAKNATYAKPKRADQKTPQRLVVQ